MNNKDLHERIKQAKEKSRHSRSSESNDETVKSPREQDLLENKVNLTHDHKDVQKQWGEHHQSPIDPPQPSKGMKPFPRRWRNFGVMALAIGIVSFFFFGDTSAVDESEMAQEALETKVSTSLSAGTILLEDDGDIGAEDFTVTHQSDADETKIWIWDYAAEDGDYVQVLVDGEPIADSFMIYHKPKELTVPTVGTVQIKGIRDGGGGITYAIRYEANGTSYFNTAPEGDYNTYELVRE